MHKVTRLSPRPGHATGCVAPVHPAERERLLDAYQIGSAHYHEGLPPKAPTLFAGHAGAEAAYLEGWTSAAIGAQRIVSRAEYLWIRRGDILATLAKADAALAAIGWVGSQLPATTRERMRDAAARVRSLRNALEAAETGGRGGRKPDSGRREDRDIALLDEADETP